MNKKLSNDNKKVSYKKLNKNQIGNGYVKKSSFIIQSDGSLRRRRIKNNYEDILLEKNNYINIIKNLNEKEFKNIKVSQKSEKKPKEKEWYKSSSSTLNELVNNLNENTNHLRKKKFKKSNSMKNLKNPNQNKRNTMYLIDKNGEFCIEFINNENNTKNDINKKFCSQSNYIINENTPLVELEQIKQRLESNILEKKKILDKKEKEKLNRNKQLNNNEFQFTLKEKKKENNITNFQESKKYNESIIYKSNNFDNLFNQKKLFRNHSVTNLYKNNILKLFSNNNSDNNSNINRKNDKQNINKSNIDFINNQSYIQNLKNLINFSNINTIDKFYFSSSTDRKNHLLKKNSLDNKKNFNDSYITDKYCDKMVGMNILSLSSSKYIKSLNEKNIGPNKNNFYYNKMLNDLEKYGKK